MSKSWGKRVSVRCAKCRKTFVGLACALAARRKKSTSGRLYCSKRCWSRRARRIVVRCGNCSRRVEVVNHRNRFRRY